MTTTRPNFAGILGVPYDQSDCWATARAVLDRFGIPTPADPAAAMLGEMRFAEVVPIWDVRAADVLIMQGEEGMHVGVAIDGLRFIHSSVGGARARSSEWLARAYSP
jgi:cell wall-associated NlpC family hydrolase